MAEVEFRVEPYGVAMACESCGIGRMLPTGDYVLATNPPKHPHQCNNTACRAVANYTERYPVTRYREVTKPANRLAAAIAAADMMVLFPAHLHPSDDLLDENGHGFFLVFDNDEWGWPHVRSYSRQFKDMQNGWNTPGVTHWTVIPKVGG